MLGCRCRLCCIRPDREAKFQIEKGGIAQGCLWAQQLGPKTNLAINFANGTGANTYQAQALNGDNRIVAEQSGLANEARNAPVLGRRVSARDSNDSGVGNSAGSADGVDPANLAQPTLLPAADSGPVRRLVRVNANALPAMPAVLSDGRGSSGEPFGNQTSSPQGISSRSQNSPVSPTEAEIPLGIFSGKPMPLWTTPPPIFDTRDRSDAAGDQNRFTTPGGLLWGGRKSKASTLGAGAPAVPFAWGRTDSFGNGAASPESGPGAGFVPPGLTAQQPRKSPASLIMDYIQRLKPLESNPSRASTFDTGAPPVRFVSPDDITGGPGSVAAPAPRLQNAQGPLSLMDAYLEYRKQLDVSLPQASTFDTSAPAAPLVPAGDANLSGGLLGRLAASMGIDPLNPDRFAPPRQDDELRGYYRDDATQPWFVPRWFPTPIASLATSGKSPA